MRFGGIQRCTKLRKNLLFQRRWQSGEGGAVDHVAAAVFEHSCVQIEIAQGQSGFRPARSFGKILFQQCIATDAASWKFRFIGEQQIAREQR